MKAALDALSALEEDFLVSLSKDRDMDWFAKRQQRKMLIKNDLAIKSHQEEESPRERYLLIYLHFEFFHLRHGK